MARACAERDRRLYPRTSSLDIVRAHARVLGWNAESDVSYQRRLMRRAVSVFCSADRDDPRSVAAIWRFADVTTPRRGENERTAALLRAAAGPTGRGSSRLEALYTTHFTVDELELLLQLAC